MKMHLSTSGKGFSLSALASAVLLLSCSTLAADLPESQFQTKPVGHGLYELAFDGTSNTLFAASTPSFAKEKTAVSSLESTPPHWPPTPISSLSDAPSPPHWMSSAICCTSATPSTAQSR